MLRAGAPALEHLTGEATRLLAILASFSSSTTPVGEAKRCSVPSSPPWSHDQTATTRKSGKAKVKSQAAEDARGPVFEYVVPNDSFEFIPI
jgi:hypothetical protein